MLLQLSHLPAFTQLHPAHSLPPTFPPYSLCPWVILISSLASTFPTLFLSSPCLFSTYLLNDLSVKILHLNDRSNPQKQAYSLILLFVFIWVSNDRKEWERNDKMQEYF